MNYIKQLQEQNNKLQSKIDEVNEELNNIRIYLSSEKFHGFENDYVHVSTDMYRKIQNVIDLINI